jgi:CPA1 family monovalent cation:H+ antiporter
MEDNIMKLLNIIAILITLSAAFGYVNSRVFKLPTTIGVMLISMLVSVGIFLLGRAGAMGLGIEEHWLTLIRSINFNKTLMVWMLGFLLFAGALQVDLGEMLKQKWEVLILATIGVIISTVIIATLLFLVSGWMHLPLKFIHCLLFGALASPTDPIAVLKILREAGLSKKIETIITGESLFNDGIGVVVFVTLLSIAAAGDQAVSPRYVLLLFVWEAVGGVIFGVLLGLVGFHALKSIDDYHVEILITLSMVTGGYALAAVIQTSGPIAMVVAGLIIGNHGRQVAMSDRTRERIDSFWEFVDQILNSLLFVLIGLELLTMQVSWLTIEAGLIAIPISLIARFAAVGVPFIFLVVKKKLSTGALAIMTWGGLRGGIAVALAISLPEPFGREIIIPITYMVVVFSILVQGLTVKYLVIK